MAATSSKDRIPTGRTAIAKKKSGGVLYSLGFSRIELAGLLVHATNSPEIPRMAESLHRWFGSPPYNFAERPDEPATPREFGRTHLSAKKLRSIFDTLPLWMQERAGPSRSLGHFYDAKGRVYKREFGEIWSIMTPRGKSAPFPSLDERISLVRDGETLGLVVAGVGSYRTATCRLVLRDA